LKHLYLDSYQGCSQVAIVANDANMLRTARNRWSQDGDGDVAGLLAYILEVRATRANEWAHKIWRHGHLGVGLHLRRLHRAAFTCK